MRTVELFYTACIKQLMILITVMVALSIKTDYSNLHVRYSLLKQYS